MKVTITVQGQGRLLQRIRDAQGRFENLRPFWKTVANKFFEIQRRQFATEGGSGASGRWPRLRPSTAREKQRSRFGGRPILQRSGRLYRSLTRQGGENIYRETANSVTIDSSVPYKQFHQRGTAKMRARPPISITDAQARILMQPLKRGLAQSIQRLGFAVTES